MLSCAVALDSFIIALLLLFVSKYFSTLEKRDPFVLDNWPLLPAIVMYWIMSLEFSYISPRSRQVTLLFLRNLENR